MNINKYAIANIPFFCIQLYFRTYNKDYLFIVDILLFFYFMLILIIEEIWYNECNCDTEEAYFHVNSKMGKKIRTRYFCKNHFDESKYDKNYIICIKDTYERHILFKRPVGFHCRFKNY